MRNRAYNYACHISHNVLPTPMVAVLFHVVCLLGYRCYYSKNRANYGNDKANTEVLYLVLACVRIITLAHTTST